MGRGMGHFAAALEPACLNVAIGAIPSIEVPTLRAITRVRGETAGQKTRIAHTSAADTPAQKAIASE